MKLEDLQQPTKEIYLVCGNLASGKGFYISKRFPDAQVFEVSNIVRQLSKFATRSELMTTKDLDKAIAKTLIDAIENSVRDVVVVDGIRQLSILKALEQHFGSNIKDIIWLDVPENIRRERFSSRKSAKDDQTFDQAIAGDNALGIGDVESYIRRHHKTEKN